MYPSPTEFVNYLVIGHLAVEHAPEGARIGGTAAYAGLAAHSQGVQVGVVSPWGDEIPLDPLRFIQVAATPADRSTTFSVENGTQEPVYTLQHRGPAIDYHLVPESWRTSEIVHLAPIAQEVEPTVVRQFSPALLGITPKGWLREWSQEGRVRVGEWPEASFVLNQVDAAVIHSRDVGDDPRRIEELAIAAPTLAVVGTPDGIRVYWQGETRTFEPSTPVDSHPAWDDIFAALFFVRLHRTQDAWEAGRFATQLASKSTHRPGFQAIPTPAEVQSILSDVVY